MGNTSICQNVIKKATKVSQLNYSIYFTVKLYNKVGNDVVSSVRTYHQDCGKKHTNITNRIENNNRRHGPGTNLLV